VSSRGSSLERPTWPRSGKNVASDEYEGVSAVDAVAQLEQNLGIRSRVVSPLVNVYEKEEDPLGQMIEDAWSPFKPNDDSLSQEDWENVEKRFEKLALKALGKAKKGQSRLNDTDLGLVIDWLAWYRGSPSMDALGKEPTFATTPEKESTFTTPDLRGDSELVCRSKAEEPPSGVRDLAQGTDKGDVGCAPVFPDLSERIFSSSDGVGEKLEEEDEGKVEGNAGVSSLSAGGPKMMDTEVNGDKPKPSLEGKMEVTEVGEDSSEQSDSGEEGSNCVEGSCSESDSSESKIGDAELNAEGAEFGEVLERNKDKTVLGTRPDCLGAGILASNFVSNVSCSHPVLVDGVDISSDVGPKQGGKSTPQQLLHPRCLIFCLSQMLSRISILSLHTRQQVACFGPGL
ncbi:hypothetical protein U1Q18_049015, partial [Sarracenia purpurea var. burkii]